MVATLAILSIGEAGAQTTTVSVRDGVTRGDEFHVQGRTAEALTAFTGALASDSTRFDALWRATRESVTVGMLASDDEKARGWFTQAVGFGRRAVQAEPDSVAGYQWLAIALGRQALLESPRTKVRLSEEVRTTALRALEIDSTAAGAHNVLGQWHAEIRRLSGLTRFAAERLLGGDTFREASWESAEWHLRRATELEPDAPIHRLALAKVLLDLDRIPEARAQLELAVALPLISPTDSITRSEAGEILRRLGR
jgi:tetratricopeptide (TPR) repeat protein